MNEDDIQQPVLKSIQEMSCGLVMNEDDIQRKLVLTQSEQSCGLVMTVTVLVNTCIRPRKYLRPPL